MQVRSGTCFRITGCAALIDFFKPLILNKIVVRSKIVVPHEVLVLNSNAPLCSLLGFWLHSRFFIRWTDFLALLGLGVDDYTHLLFSSVAGSAATLRDGLQLREYFLEGKCLGCRFFWSLWRLLRYGFWRGGCLRLYWGSYRFGLLHGFRCLSLSRHSCLRCRYCQLQSCGFGRGLHGFRRRRRNTLLQCSFRLRRRCTFDH